MIDNLHNFSLRVFQNFSQKFQFRQFRLAYLSLGALVAICVAIGVLSVSARIWNARQNTNGVSTSSPTQEPSRSKRIAVRTTIYPTGFEPEEFNCPAGRVHLYIRNRTGLEDVSVILEKVSGERVHDVRMKDGELDSSQIVNLAPGQYRLREANNSTWVCNINITPPRQ